jgi:N6-L-threonylcarbamoyladenine synthase
MLGIETSCDESAVCLIDADGTFENDFHFRVLGNAVISQIAIHAQYGGVFPNLAKREHAKNLVPLLEQTLQQSGMTRQGKALPETAIAQLQALLAREPELYEQLIVFFKKYAPPEIDAIAVTVGPGLEPALWVGINFARALALVWDVPVVAVNHMEGHIVMALVRHENFQFAICNLQNETDKTKSYTLNAIRYPILSLLISGGHTELVLSKKWQEYEIIGATRDDAVGEAFDKVARLLGLPYPGGPEISRLATQARTSYEMTSHRITLPRPMLHDDNLDFSFAGLKTAVRRIVESQGTTYGSSSRSGLDAFRMQIACEFEDAVADVLVAKTTKAVDDYGVQTVVVGGGVSANKHIKKKLAEAVEKAGLPPPLISPPALATDNALMIALAGYFRAQNREFVNPDMLKAVGNLRLK